MCIGLQCNNVPLFSFETKPWSPLPKTSLRPKNTDYGKEIARRAKLFNISPIPRPSHWTRQQTIEWLQQNPVHDDVDVDFLTMEVARLCGGILIRAQQQQEETCELVAANASNVGGRWRGSVPYLCVIMCLTQDQVKALFRTRADVQTRQTLDARHSERRPKTVFEVISDLWNSPEFNPIAPASDCHVDYVSATICSYEQVAALLPATPQKIQDIFAPMQSDLLRIISRWEQSGQGKGGIDQEDYDESHDAAEFLSCASSSVRMTKLVMRNKIKAGGEADQDILMGHLLEGQLVLRTLEPPSLTVDLPIFCTFGRY
ncbi:hypothetical protein MHU86_7643 [Fragilaria crotonensis]|nr:hypothetical protein MHU86_7643 [Fragilaria crotonensis]